MKVHKKKNKKVQIMIQKLNTIIIAVMKKKAKRSDVGRRRRHFSMCWADALILTGRDLSKVGSGLSKSTSAGR